MSAEVELDGMLRRLRMPTVRRLWSELQVRAEQEGMSYADYLQTLVGEEIAHRGQTRVSRMMHRAKFPFLRTVEEFDFAFQSGLRKELLGSYLGPEFVSEGRSLIAYGPSGQESWDAPLRTFCFSFSRTSCSTSFSGTLQRAWG